MMITVSEFAERMEKIGHPDVVIQVLTGLEQEHFDNAMTPIVACSGTVTTENGLTEVVEIKCLREVDLKAGKDEPEQLQMALSGILLAGGPPAMIQGMRNMLKPMKPDSQICFTNAFEDGVILRPSFVVYGQSEEFSSLLVICFRADITAGELEEHMTETGQKLEELTGNHALFSS